MTNINPQNYVGASAVVVGYAASDPRFPAYDKDQSGPVRELPIPINEGYSKDGEFHQTGTTWYTYVATAEWFEDNLDGVGKGDKIRIDGAKQEVREYVNKDGEKVKAISLRFGDVTVLESASEGGDF